MARGNPKLGSQKERRMAPLFILDSHLWVSRHMERLLSTLRMFQLALTL